jgi:DnaJ-class molecular chaperone
MWDHSPYDILGITRNASLSDIKKAYRRLALRFHPDRNRSSLSASEKFKQINEAYEVLTQNNTEFDNQFYPPPPQSKHAAGDFFRGSSFDDPRSLFEEYYDGYSSRGPSYYTYAAASSHYDFAEASVKKQKKNKTRPLKVHNPFTFHWNN